MKHYSIFLLFWVYSALGSRIPLDHLQATDAHPIASVDNDISENESKNIKALPDKSEWYPSYHLAPPTGWMNDPNGLIEFEGYFHFFYQHNPSAPIWGPMHWGHARSKDMMEWEHLPIALTPSLPADKDGCFSGSAVNHNGTLTLVYTGHSILNDSTVRQVQCLATSGDALHFEKQGPVLDIGAPNFRDPKVWKEKNGLWYMVAGYRTSSGGEARLYKSSDLRHWDSEGVLAEGSEDQGFMWECPDFFELDGKHVLVLSPQGMSAHGYDNRNLYQSGYMVGEWAPGAKKLAVEEDFREMDHGHDFYAPQSFLAQDGRRIVVGWMAMWEQPMPEQGQGWATHMTIPREVTLEQEGDDTKLVMTPVREVESWRTEPSTRTQNLNLDRQHHQLECNVTSMEVMLQWNLTNTDAEGFGLRLGDDNSENDRGVFVLVDMQSRRLVLDRNYPQYNLTGYRSVPMSEESEILTVRLFFDRSSLEVFAWGASISSRIYPASDERCLSVFAENGHATLMSATRWTLAKKNSL